MWSFLLFKIHSLTDSLLLITRGFWISSLKISKVPVTEAEFYNVVFYNSGQPLPLMKKMSDHGLSTVICLVWKWCYFPLAMENLTVINFVYFSGCSIGRECVIAKTIVTESATLCPRAYSGRCVCVPGCVHHQKFIPQGYLKYEGRCSYCKCFPDGRVSLSSISPITYFNFLY